MSSTIANCHQLLASEEGRTKHGFFTRQGGVSTGLYASLNVGLGSEDDRAAIEQNRKLVAGYFDVRTPAIATPHQIHGNQVVVADAPNGVDRPKGDAIVTTTPGLIIGVLTADCGPVLFVDEQAGVVAAAHAGWKGAKSGVLEATIAAMNGLGAARQNIKAVLGPTISRDNYEVGVEFRTQFLSDDAGYDQFFARHKQTGNWHFDLPAFVLHRLEAADIQAASCDECTYAHTDRYFSFRRATHNNEPDYGRQISATMLCK